MNDDLQIENSELDELFEKFRKAPDSFVFVPLADACRKMGRLDEALAICNQGLDRHPGYASGHIVKGKCLYDQKEVVAAADVFNDVIKMDPDNLVALKFLGMIDADAGRFDEARHHFRRILELDPENKEIGQALQTVAEQEQFDDDEMADDVDDYAREEGSPTEETDDSFEGAAIILGNDEETPDELATITLADIFASQGYRDKALAIYQEVIKAQPGNRSVLDKINQLTGATAVAEPPTSDEVDLAEANMAELSNDDDGEVFGVSDVVAVSAPPVATHEPADAKKAPATTPRKKQRSKRRKKAKPAATNAARSSKEATKTISDSSKSNRREIEDSDSVSHFKRWINRMDR